MSLQSVKIYTRYDRPVVAGLSSTLPSMADQGQFQSTDINYLVTCMREGYDVAQQMYSDKPQMYFDTTSVASFEEQITTQAFIRSEFMSLPASIREQFDNDVSVYVGAMCEAENWPVLAEMGLLEMAKGVQSAIEGTGAVTPPGGDLASAPAPAKDTE